MTLTIGEGPAAGESSLRVLEGLDRALESVDELVPMDEARFLATHLIYEGRSNQRRRILEWFDHEVTPNNSTNETFDILSVGCGGGHLDVPIASALFDRKVRLRYAGVDPNRVECESFTRLWRSAGLDDSCLDVVAESFEDFEAFRSFDLIHLVHCLYYMPEPMDALERSRRLLACGGRLVVFQAPREELNELSVRFYDKQYDRPTLFSEDLSSLLDKRGWPYERQRIDASLEASPLLNGDSETRLALRDFIIQVDGRRLPEAVQELVSRYLRSILVRDGENHRIAHPVDVFVIAE